jgi:arsenate reductase (glutaredoxin)
MIVYGIKNCDTMKKAFAWLDEQGIPYEFHNYQTKGISEEKVDEWIAKIGIENVINKKGTTYKKLPPETQALLDSPETAIRVILEKTSMIKRPLVEVNGNYLVGFNQEEWKALLK